MEQFKAGDRVRASGISSGARYEGTVIRTGGRMFGAEALITITDVIKGKGQLVGTDAYVDQVERIEEMSQTPYVKNLVGPKPEPVQEPAHPTPWTSDGSNVLDANGTVVIRIVLGGYRAGHRSELPIGHRYELARLIAEAVTEKFEAKVSQSPF